MSDTFERVNRLIDLDKEFQTAIMNCTAGRIDDSLFDQFANLESGYSLLLEESEEGDQLVQPKDLRKKIADVTDWRAQALKGVHRFKEAIEAFESAAQLYTKVGKPSAAQQALDKAGELRLELSGDFDAEISRLRDRLETVKPASLERVEVIIALGELYSLANDDFEATAVLEEAQTELAKLGGHPSDSDLLGSLMESVQRVEKGEQIAGRSPIEIGIRRRALTQRLLLALGNAYRTTNPTKAGEYEARLRELDDGLKSDLRGLIGQFLDADQDVGALLKRRGR